MADDQPRNVQFVLECEARIGRMRAAIRAGRSYDEQVSVDLMALLDAVRPTFLAFARKLAWIGQHAVDEAFDAMNDRLLEDIWSPTYPSLETGFGVYLKQMPIRRIQRVGRNFRAGAASELIERLDEAVFEDGAVRHESLEDPRAFALFGELLDNAELQEAIERLPEPERTVVELRMREIANADIAERLGVSPPTATRIWKRAVVLLRQFLGGAGE